MICSIVSNDVMSVINQLTVNGQGVIRGIVMGLGIRDLLL